MSTPEVVIFGASGYTGKLIAWHLAERGIPFIAAGRDQKRLEEQMASVPELKGHDYECVAVDLEEQALTKLFSGRKIVYNVVGPFMQLSEPVVRACLNAGVHYLDTTGEQDWMLMLREKYHKPFQEKGLLLCPANAFMWTAGEIAAEVALEESDIDSLDILYIADSATSVASTASFLRMCCRDQYYLKNHELEVWPHTTSYNVSVPGEHPTYQALPWSGAGEPTWYLDDDRVRNCSVLVAFRRRDVMAWVVERITDWYENYRHLPRAEQEPVFNEWGWGLVSEEPPREDPDLNRSTLSCMGRGRTKGVNVVLRGNCPYIQAGVWAAEAVRRILIGKLRATGYASPCKAFGHRELLAATAEKGYLTWEKQTV
ncbi:saccharopine dehydrogenase [Salinisphaera sp. PC39]|uniref:saccharopine dehydrogenase family protein n=1 Tax=Salinisphaera sp. PC39 TaxID=1304156 RepID=UPI00333ECBFC